MNLNDAMHIRVRFFYNGPTNESSSCTRSLQSVTQPIFIEISVEFRSITVSVIFV